MGDNLSWFYDLRMCRSKVVFTSYESAVTRARSLNLYVYQCSLCKQYHLTKNPDAKPSLDPNQAERRRKKDSVVRAKMREEWRVEHSKKREDKTKLRNLRKKYLSGEIPLEEYNRLKQHIVL